jgi:GT2 family glycosyltransferase
MVVLVATPVRLSTPQRIVERAQAVYDRLTYSPRERALYFNEQPRMAAKFGPNAAARNQLIERYLRPWHEWVLWLDADIIETPADLIEQLLDVSSRHGLAVVAPMVWVERNTKYEIGGQESALDTKEGPTLQTGGWFYDTGGFVDGEGRFADFARGPAGEEVEIPMRSVGCVYVAPAFLYRQGLRYRPLEDEVEHLSFCRDVAARGLEIVATRAVNVTHAYLPRYGESWQHTRMEATYA